MEGNTQGRGRGRGQNQDRGRGRGRGGPGQNTGPPTLYGRGATNRNFQNTLSSTSSANTYNPSFRGRGRGQGRGRNNTHGRGSPHARGDYPTVPSHSSIHPSTPVSIILKADQPTGHRVHGIVSDILTRGDHPRGVKVRLRDGRVGRVQALCSLATGEEGERVAGGPGAGLGRDGEGGSVGRGGAGGSARMVGGRIERDIRENDEYFYDEERRKEEVSGGWLAALEEADRRHAGGNTNSGGNVGGAVEVARCPVCGDFQGDERAVAFHVEGHFT